MKSREKLNCGTIERLEKQGGFLLRMYRAQLAKDPTSRETESSRSNLIAMRQTIQQLYGDVFARDVPTLFALTAPHLYEPTES